MIKYCKFTDNIGSGNFTDTFTVGAFKAFIKPFEATQKSVKIKI